MTEKKPYEQPEDCLGSLVQDDSVIEYATTTYTEAFSQVRQMELPPYTMEELNARIDEAEEQFARGEFLTSEEVHRRVLEFLNSRKCS